MLTALRDIIFILLSLLGLVDLFRIIVCRLFKTKSDKNLIILVPVKSNSEDAEILLRSAAAKAMWVYSGAIERVICLDCGADEETKRICRRVCDEYSFMEYKDSIE